jgi:fructoselysine-6-P-deglycase FrlB-like protein
MGSFPGVETMLEEIASQPECWRRAGELSRSEGDGALPKRGERVAFAGCGSSWHMAQCAAVFREMAGQGAGDAFPASEPVAGRGYDLLVVISRTGTTTEVLRLLDSWHGASRSLAVTATRGSPLATSSGSAVVVDFADEVGVVQTRSATTALALLLASAGCDLEPAIASARRALDRGLPGDLHGARRHVFLATGWAVGLAEEAALKLRESAGAWAEAYPAMEYRHGPASALPEESLVWEIGILPAGVREFAASTGSTVVGSCGEPMGDLVLVQRAAVELAVAAGRDPAWPPHLGRSVILG